MQNRIIINPLDPHLCAEKKSFFTKLLIDHMEPNGILKANYFNQIEGSQKQIRVTHAIIRRGTKDQYHYDVLGDRLGSGAYSNVYNILATIKLTSTNELDIKLPSVDKQRIIKKMTWNQKKEKHTLDVLKNEFNLLRRLSIFRVKKPIITGENLYENAAYLIEHRFKGSDLYQLLGHTKLRPADPDYIQLSVDDRILLSIRILKFIQRLHRYKIVHNDLKPENIIVDPSSLEVGVIDLGLSMSVECDNTGEPSGTVYYASPETFAHKRTSFKSDIFSMARVISELWGAKEHILDTENELAIGTRFKEIRFTADYCKTIELFDRINLTSDQHKLSISRLLGEMSYRDPAKRCSIEHTIDIFETIQLERALEHIPTTFHKEVAFAHKQALNVRKHAHIETLAALIKDALKMIGRSSQALKQFLIVLDIKEWLNFNSKDEVKNALATLLTEYKSNIKKIKELQPNIQTSKQFETIAIILHRIESYPLNLIEILEHNKTMSAKIQKIANALWPSTPTI